MKKNIERIQLVYNLDDPYQAKIYQYIINSSNKSATGKRLLDIGWRVECGIHTSRDTSAPITHEINNKMINNQSNPNPLLDFTTLDVNSFAMGFD
ncbi:hypothetical protein NSQ89_15060 [Niallia sp. FSL R7-0648]|uniref:hypothetical protein n=1 Tax=Niallia sp. FSL R7-0648 TaxID=2954521 RepID=UPI0030F9F5DE